MNFLLDENIPMSVFRFLVGRGYNVEFIRDLIPEGSVDPLVAFVAEDEGAILVTNDGDFQSIAPRIPDGQKRRFKKLSRIWIRCNEYQAAARLEKIWDFVELEHRNARSDGDGRMIVQVGNAFIRSDR
jgi:predicted nuclease of predicted toxin-antitoxin system